MYDQDIEMVTAVKMELLSLNYTTLIELTPYFVIYNNHKIKENKM